MKIVIDIMDLINFAGLIFGAGVAVGQFVEMMKSKNDRPTRKGHGHFF